MKPSDIAAGGLRLATIDRGTHLAVSADGELEPLARVLTIHQEGRISGLPDAVRGGEDFMKEGVVVTPAPEEYEPEVADATWQRLTGHPIGDDVLSVGTVYTPFVELPRPVFLDFIAQLAPYRRPPA